MTKESDPEGEEPESVDLDNASLEMSSDEVYNRRMEFVLGIVTQQIGMCHTRIVETPNHYRQHEETKILVKLASHFLDLAG